MTQAELISTANSRGFAVQLQQRDPPDSPWYATGQHRELACPTAVGWGETIEAALEAMLVDADAEIEQAKVRAEARAREPEPTPAPKKLSLEDLDLI